MQVLDKDNNIIDQWTSGSEPHMIEGVLIAGQTYVLHEASAPAGYTLAKDVTFTVSETGEIDYVQMIDDTTKVSISKTDITGEKNVSGATLQIIDKNGNVIHEWISGTDQLYGSTADCRRNLHITRNQRSGRLCAGTGSAVYR